MNEGVPDAVIKSITKKDIDDFYKMARKFKPEGGYGATAKGGRVSALGTQKPYGITKSIPNYAKLTTDNKVRAINAYYENLVKKDIVYGTRNWQGGPTVIAARSYDKAKIWYEFLDKFGAVTPKLGGTFNERDKGWSEFNRLTEGESKEASNFPKPVERSNEPVQPITGSVADILKGREGGRVKKPPRVRKKPFEKLEQAFPSQEVVKKQITIKPKPKPKPRAKVRKLTEEEKAINQRLQDLGLSKARAAIVREAQKRGVSISQILDERKKASEIASKAWSMASSSI